MEADPLRVSLLKAQRSCKVVNTCVSGGGGGSLSQVRSRYWGGRYGQKDEDEV